MDISLLITLHDEGELAQPTLLAAARAREQAAQRGWGVELVLALDRASVRMRRVVDAFELAAHDQVLQLDVGDVGASRNAAMQFCRGRYVAICDGDDLLSANFLEVAATQLEDDAREVIVRPQLVVQFDQNNSLGWQVGSDDPVFDPRCMLTINPWTTACMARRSLFLAVPYWVRTAQAQGLGFEDWNWNCETLAAGAVDVIAARTVHYVRIKASGSMNARYAREAAVFPPSRLFEQLK